MEKGVYRVSDDLKKFLLRVSLKRMRVTKHRESTPGSCPEEEVLVVKWNEKYFSQEEEERYANEINCTSSAEIGYHQRMLEIREDGGRLNNRLFTYTSSDIGGVLQCVNNAVGKLPCVLNGREIDTRASIHCLEEGSVQKGHTPFRAVVNKPSKMERNANRFPNTTGLQSMFLMADLRQTDGIDDADEHVLCQLTIGHDGILTISPDINGDNPWYRVENRHKEVFEYNIKNISPDINPEERRKHQRLVTKINDMSVEPDLEFESERGLLVYVFGNIVSVTDYDSGNLYVRTEVDPGRGWHLDDSVAIATTQICNPINCVAHFSCPFEYKLVSNDQGTCPSIAVEVCSLDAWDRHRVEGYGMTCLPIQPGCHSIILHTWRPKPRYLIEKLRHFFIGGGPQLQDNLFASSTIGNRYGLRTNSSGSVELCLYIIIQQENVAQT